MAILTTRITPLAQQVIQPDAPHLAALDARLCAQATAVALRLCGTRRTWAWPDVASAPRATITALDTWTSFVLGDATLQVPWVCQEQFHRIRSVIAISADAALPLQVRLVGYSMVQAVATQNGDASDVAATGGLGAQERGWSGDSVARRRYAAATDLRPAAYASDRRFAIGAQVKIKLLNAAAPWPTSSERYVYLNHLLLADVHERQG